MDGIQIKFQSVISRHTLSCSVCMILCIVIVSIVHVRQSNILLNIVQADNISCHILHMQLLIKLVTCLC